MNLGARLEQGLLAKNISGAELARRAGLPNRHMISRLKSGEIPGFKYVEHIARELGCTVEWLTGGTGAPPTWSTMQASGGAKSAGAAAMSAHVAPLSPAQFDQLMARLDRLEKTLADRLPKPVSMDDADALIDAALADGAAVVHK